MKTIAADQVEAVTGGNITSFTTYKKPGDNWLSVGHDDGPHVYHNGMPVAQSRWPKPGSLQGGTLTQMFPVDGKWQRVSS